MDSLLSFRMLVEYLLHRFLACFHSCLLLCFQSFHKRGLLSLRTDCFLVWLEICFHVWRTTCFSLHPENLLSCFLERLPSWNLVFKFSKPLSFRPLSFYNIKPILLSLKSGANKRRKAIRFRGVLKCPRLSSFVLITHYFTAFLIPVTLHPNVIGKANHAPDGGSVPISANSNPSVGGFLLHWQIARCPKQLEILSAALNALPGRSRDRVTPKS